MIWVDQVFDLTDQVEDLTYHKRGCISRGWPQAIYRKQFASMNYGRLSGTTGHCRQVGWVDTVCPLVNGCLPH
jgi:hypothetical protein